ncbi:chain length determinant protein [Novosphingobium nitrogenifigens DSM 19370]|uniref:Chain length determinant protein n=1 Tax=Novosphingobium nitrogenifigens DSM 19370 TaxID=983920 RepID=F1Z525_9SPHN|nr:chain length determinant protein [Novosphingobium nitrogenifigens]EGD59990.1 chain length determinant protein [Novosphingobium nitrogenifigens DSM 19370]
MSFVQIIRILLARRKLLGWTVLGCFLCGLAAIALIPTKYEATSRVLLDLVKPDPVTQQVLSTNFARAYITTQSDVITDYRVIGRVVDALGWTNNPSKIADYNDSDAKGTVDIRRWLAEQIIKNTDAKPLVDSNIMEISYRARTPDEARRIADLIRDAYVEETIAFRREGATRNAEWFRQQARKIADELTSVEQQKSAFEKQSGVVLQSDYSDPDSERLKALASQLPTPSAYVAPPAASPSSIQLAQVDAQIATLSNTLGPNHPQIVALRQQREALAKSATEERTAALAAARANAGGGPPIASQVATQQARVLAQRDKIDQLRKIQARVDVLRDQYNKTMQRAGELGLEAASRESGLTVLGNAVAPDTPVAPKVLLILAGSIGGGIVLGLILAVGAELTRRRVRSVEDLATLGVPVIGRLMSEA